MNKKHNVLMMGLFAVVGFNVSLNPQSIEVRRTIASQKAAQQIEMASEEHRGILSFQLGEILDKYKEQEISASRKVTVVKEGDKVKKINVIYRLNTDTEGQLPSSFNCRECAKWTELKLDASLFSADEKKFNASINEEVAIALETKLDKERAAPRGRPESSTVAAISDNCNQADLGDRLSCKAEKLDDILDRCGSNSESTEQERRRCMNQIANYYRDNLAETLRMGLMSDSEYTRSSAASVRDRLFRALPQTSELGNGMRVKLVEQTLVGLKAAAQKSYDDSLKECRPQVRTQLELNECAKQKTIAFLSSARSSGFGNVALAGESLLKKFNEDMEKWVPNGAPQIRGQQPGQRVVAGPNGPRAGNRMQVKAAVCPGPQCPRPDRFSFFPTPVGPNGQGISQGFKPYTGQPQGGAPGSSFLRPF